MISSETREFASFLRKRIGTTILFGLIFSLVSFYALVLSQKRYEAKTDFLIVQDQMENQDFYSLSKSAEYLGGILSEAVYSSIFINELKNTNKVDSEYFPSNERDLMKKWKKAVKIERSPNLGIIKVKVYDNNKETAIGISQGISEIMLNKNYLFRGKVNMEVRVLSGPITEKNPNIGEIFFVVIMGFLAGLAIKLMHVYYVFIGMLVRREEREEYLNSLREIR